MIVKNIGINLLKSNKKPMELVTKGAEANLYRENGKLIKKRVKKTYRIPTLDRRLRKARTKHEVKILEKLRNLGVPVPRVLDVDIENHTIVMTYIDGTLLKKVFDKESKETITGLSKQIGETLAKLHSNNMIHNDLTTSNMILKDDKIYFIDLGLGYHSTRLEDRAMDLVVFKKSLMATHPKNFETIWNGMLKGYKGNKEILTRVEQIEKRVRYA